MTPPYLRKARKLYDGYFEEAGAECPYRQAQHELECYIRRGRTMPDKSLTWAIDILKRSVVDVEDVTENYLELDLFIDRLEPFDEQAGAETFGLTVPATRTIYVCERAIAYMPLYRATVMHEVAHVILHGESTKAAAYAP